MRYFFTWKIGHKRSDTKLVADMTTSSADLTITGTYIHRDMKDYCTIGFGWISGMISDQIPDIDCNYHHLRKIFLQYPAIRYFASVGRIIRIWPNLYSTRLLDLRIKTAFLCSGCNMRETTL